MIVCEIGQNFVGDIELAKELIGLAKINGADLAKFQLYDSKKLYGEYQDTELNKDQAFELFNYGKEVGIEVFFSVFDTERVKWCEEIRVKQYKIASGKCLDADLVEAIKKTGKHITISIPPSVDLMSLWTRLSRLAMRGNVDFLYCINKYPAPLSRLQFERVNFRYYSGFSDHTIGLDVAKIAIARGAKIIEKHFAIDHKTGVDAEWSMTPGELRELVAFSKTVEQVL